MVAVALWRIKKENERGKRERERERAKAWQPDNTQHAGEPTIHLIRGFGQGGDFVGSNIYRIGKIL